MLINKISQFSKLKHAIMSSYYSYTTRIHSDPLFCKGFHSSSPSRIIGKIVSTNSYNNHYNAFSGSRSGVGLTVKNCFDSHKTAAPAPAPAPAHDHQIQKAAPRAFAPHRQLVRDLETRFCEDNPHVKLANGKRGTPLGFPDHQKIVVAVDVDEVLGNFVSALNRFIADRYSLNHSVSEYHVYEFFRIWNCSRDEADIRVHEFFKTQYFKKGIHPIPGAQKALHKLSRFCNLSVVTSRQHAIKDHTLEWIDKYYPGLFQEIHFGNHFALDGETRSKSEICRSLGAKVLIDDNPRYAIECAEVGIRVLLFDYENSYPWCKTDSINKHPLVTKVHNWEEAEELLVSWIVS